MIGRGIRPLGAASALFALSFCPGCTAKRTAGDGPGIVTGNRSSEEVAWGEVVDGLQLGILLPHKAFVFDGGWANEARLRVHLRNRSDTEIVWSDCRRVWSVLFSGEEFMPPEHFTAPVPPPVVGEPRQLKPKETGMLDIHIAQAFVVWPEVAEGKYAVSVAYAPASLRTHAVGGEGNYRRPFDVPGFWSSTVSTPTVTVEVKPRMPILKDPKFREVLEGVVAKQAKQYPRREPDEFHMVACADQLVSGGATEAEVRELLGEPRRVVVATWRYDWDKTGAHTSIQFLESGVYVCSDNFDPATYGHVVRKTDRIKEQASQEQVRQILGEPTHVDSSQAWEYYHYGDPEAYAYFRFENGKVVEVSSGWAPWCE